MFSEFIKSVYENESSVSSLFWDSSNSNVKLNIPLIFFPLGVVLTKNGCVLLWSVGILYKFWPILK